MGKHMITLVSDVLDIYKKYSGNSLFMVLFLCSLVFLFCFEKEKGRRTILVYGSVCLLLLFFLPIFSYVMIQMVFDGEVYYRFLWLLPVNVVIAYSAVRLVIGLKNKRMAVLAYLLLMVVLISGGDFVYNNGTFLRAQNLYHIPQSVIDVCEVIEPEEGEDWINAAMPAQMLSYVRQYSTRIHMPYGRAVLIDRWNLGHPMYDTMEADVIDANLLAQQADEYACDYVVLPQEKQLSEDLERYGFTIVNQVSGYCIYQNIVKGNNTIND